MMKNLRTLKGFPVQASQTQPPWQEEYHQWTRMVWMRKERGLDEQESHVNILAWCVALAVSEESCSWHFHFVVV